MRNAVDDKPSLRGDIAVDTEVVCKPSIDDNDGGSEDDEESGDVVGKARNTILRKLFDKIINSRRLITMK